ncbi:MAG: LemA family protein [Gammaproteobacteria bacterium]
MARESEERIARMAAEGVISPELAQRLRASLVRPSRQDMPRRAAGGWTPLLPDLVFLALALWILAILVGDPSPPDIQNVRDVLNEPGSVGHMNNLVTGIFVLFLVVALPIFGWIWLHNGLVTKEEATHAAWAQVESNFQRRADLIPALLETVSRYLDHEAETFKAVTETRNGNLAQAVGDLVDAQAAAAALMERHGEEIIEDEEALTALESAERVLGARMGSFMAVAESYPELRSSDQFLELQAQLEGTENRINVTRMRFNEAVRAYNSSVRKIPTSLVARVGDFRRKAYFKAEPNAIQPPELSFQ